MHWELVDTLRCLAPHEESWLVAAADRTEGRHIMAGVLGCPVCRAQYPIVEGIAHFRGGEAARGSAAPSSAAPSAATLDPDDAMKLAAMLDLTDGRGHVLLAGAWATLGAALRELVPVAVLAVNPPAGVAMGDGISGLRTGDRLPLAPGSARGAAIGPDEAGLLPSLIDAVRGGGRLAADVALPPPGGVEVIARDERHWVAEAAGGSRGGPLLKLVRGSG